MATRGALFLLALVALAAAVRGYQDEGRQWQPEEEEEEGEERTEFLMQEAEEVVRTEAGQVKVVRGFPGRYVKNPLHIAFITMEPSSFFIPQYLDSSLILFVRRGEARVGHIHKDELVETTLRIGDVYRIAAGSAFNLINTAEGQRLHIISAIATNEATGWQPFQVSEAELMETMTKQQRGPIIYLSDSPASDFLKMGKHQRLESLKRMYPAREDDEDEEEEEPVWSIKELLLSFLRKRGDDRRAKSRKGGRAYNLYDRKPDFRNNYGWSVAVYDSDYKPLRHEDVSVYLVNLTAGSMMAPHINRKASEYGVVLAGAGRIQIVYPNGTLAMDSEVAEGDVFWIPRFFPFCQIASRSGPLEFFGFTTSARNNRPQFLAGAGSILQAMRGPELAAAFGVPEDRMNEIIDAQLESTILPSATVAPPDQVESAPARGAAAHAFRTVGLAAMEVD